MRLNYIRDAPLILADQLLGQEKSKKGNKNSKQEMGKMLELNQITETFGDDFDKRFYRSLFDEINFKEMKSLFNTINTKTQFFIKKFTTILNRSNFISIFSEILMKSENLSSAQEIFEGLGKIMKLTDDNQLKILISLVLSTNERFVSDAKELLLEKCKEVEEKGKTVQLSQSTVQTLLLMVDSFDQNKKYFLNFNKWNTYQSTDKLKQISDIERLLDIATEDPIEMEKIYLDIGPYMINNNITLPENELLSTEIDEKRLADFVMNVIKHQSWVEDKENIYVNKVFMKTFFNDKPDIPQVMKEESTDIKNVTWNIDNFYQMFEKSISQLDPSTVFSYFDDSAFSIKDKKQFDFFIHILQKMKILTNQNQIFEFIFKKWTNELNQLEFIKFLINTPQNDFFSFKNYNGKKVKKNIELNQNVTKSANSYLIEPWSCVELIEILLKLSSGNYYVKVKEMFDWPIKNIPEIIAMGLMSIKIDTEDFLYDELIQEVLTLFLGNHMSSFSVIEEVWNNNKELVIKTISNMYNSSPDLMNLSRILDITQKLKDSLLLLVDCDDYKFAVNLAILAVKRDFLHIEQWLKERIEKVGDEFIMALLSYIKDNLIAHCKANTTTKENILEKSQLTLESLAVIFENLVNAKPSNNPKISPKTEAEIKEVYKGIFEIFDEFQLQPLNSEEIEQRANHIFQSLFKGDTSVFDTIQQLKNYKDSTDHQDREIYACMIHCLLDEYRFYHQYPEKQLTTISTLFGQIINHSLIEGVIETIALKYILEGIKKGSGPMFTFGITALQQFIDTKLPTLHKFLTSIVELPQLKNSPPVYEKVLEKYNQVNRGAAVPQGNDPKADNAMSFTPQQNPALKAPSPSPAGMKSPSGMKVPQFGNGLVSFDEITDQNKKMLKLNNEKPFYNSNMGGLNVGKFSKKDVSPFFMQGNQMMEDFSMNPVSPIHNMTQMQVQGMQNMNMGNMSGLNLSMGQSEDDKSFKGFNNPYEMSMPGFSRDQSTTLNQSGNISNLSMGSEMKSPKRQSKTKLARPQQTGCNINEILGVDAERVQPPNQEMIGDMKFFFNSMSKSNVSEKANELKNLLNNSNIIKWFSNSFVRNRVSVENNNHPLYNDLINFVDNKELNACLIKDTIYYINRLLQSDTVDKELKEKSVLKNLGNWLGLMTLSKNKPILAKDLDLKEILFNAYENGKLSAVVTFVSKILEHSAKTKVFHAKNPWMHAIITLLVELSTKPNLKQNLTFEIDNLFKKLEIDPTTYPKTKQFDKLTLPANSPDFSRHQQQQQQQHEIQTEKINLNELYNKISQLDSYIIDILTIINAHSSTILQKQDLVTTLTKVLSASINDIIGPVVERAVNISLFTTKELVIKDFLFDMDETRFKTSSANCIKSLAGSLALVTSKEPLRIGYHTKLKEILISQHIESEGIDSIINNQPNDLLDIGCSYIHNYVIKKAIEKIQKDEDILREIERRKRGKPFDMNNPLVQKSRNLPELIRPNPNGLSKEQYQIYVNYDKIYESYTKFEQKPKSTVSSVLNIILRMLKEVLESDGTNKNKKTKNYEVCMVNIQNISHEPSINLDESGEQLQILEKFISDSNIRDQGIEKELAQISCRYALIAVKKQNTQLLNIYTSIIKGWVGIQSSIKKDITQLFFAYADISIKFNLELHSMFIKKEIILLSDYQDYLIEALESPLTRAVCRKLLNDLKERNLYNPTTFEKIPLFMLDKDLSETYFTLFCKKNRLPSELNIQRENIIDYKICNIKDVKTYKIFSNMCTYAFNQIVETIHPFHSFKIEKLEAKIKSFLVSPFVSNEEQMNVFIMIITELCMKRANVDTISPNKDHYYPENEAKTIYALLSVVPRTTNKLKMFSNILFGIFKTFHFDYVKSNVNFNQRTYYKLFFNFISYLGQFKSNEEILNSEYKKIDYLIILAEFFKIISPVNYPGFAFAWLDLISCKNFVTAFLDLETRTNNISIFEKYLYLIIDLFTYLKSSANENLNDFASKSFLDSVMKLIYLLCNSFPEFISGYYYILLVSLRVGNTFVQLKNLILSCGPKEIDRPDPFSEDNKDLFIIEKKRNAVILFEIGSILQDYAYKHFIDNYCESKSETLIDDLCVRFNKTKNKDFNFYVLNCIVIYWAQKKIKHLQEKKLTLEDFSDFFIKMLKGLDPDNRDLLIHSMLNELRYPSNQTILFSTLIVSILCELKSEVYEEHIIKNMIDRLLYKPSPWGLVYTFGKILKGNKYPLAKKNFFRNGGEELFQKIFNNIRRTEPAGSKAN